MCVHISMIMRQKQGEKKEEEEKSKRRVKMVS